MSSAVPPPGEPVPDPRPSSDAELGFTRMPPVRWYHPKVLLDTGLRVGASAAMGDFLDKRELQQAVPGRVIDEATGRREAWVDFLADTGDGFDATYTMAWVTAQHELAVDGVPRPLPRGDLLLLGGDEVYPSGDAEEYENRFRGPFRAALPFSPTGTEPRIAAIPGNHDWYDGLTNFLRIFSTTDVSDKKWIGGRRTDQARSYFAIRLPQDWWLWGIDIQFDAYIDEPQLAYFRDVARQMGPGARLILCTGEPSWADVRGEPEAFRNLAYLDDRVIRPAGLRLLLSLSGDSHHYARYEGVDGTHKITAGGGGAFLHPTHHLDETLDIPADPHRKTTVRHHLRRRYPEASVSRWRSLGAVRLPWTNPQFLILPAVLYLLLGWTSELTTRALRADAPPFGAWSQTVGFDDALYGLARSQIAVVPLLVVVGGLIGFAKPPASLSMGTRKVATKVAMGVVHMLLHLLTGGLVTIVAVDVASLVADGGALYVVALAVAFTALGAVAAGFVFGVYLALCCGLLKAHGNEAFSALALTGYKSFLRLHVDETGTLTVYAIGIQKACKAWRYDPDNPDPSAAWLAPEQAPMAALIEEPIVIDPTRTPPKAVP